MFGTQPPLRTRERVGARRPTNDPHSPASSSSNSRPSVSRAAPRGPYRTSKDWTTLDPSAAADYNQFEHLTHHIHQAERRNAAADLARDYVDVWAEHGDFYQSHVQFRGEWQAAMQRRGLQASGALSSSSSAPSYDPLSDALFVASDGHMDIATPEPLNSSAPSVALDSPLPSDDARSAASENNNTSDDEREEETCESQSNSDASTASRTQRRALDSVQFPSGSKNAKRRRERSAARIHNHAARMQQRLADTEQEIANRTSVTAPVAAPTPAAQVLKPVKKVYTTDDFFDALDAAVKHAQATSSSATMEHSSITHRPSGRDAEPTPDVHTTEYMRQVCGEIMGDIDLVVAYRMILTVDYVRHVHQFWSARMHVPLDARPRMSLRAAAAFLRNDSLFIDCCRVIENSETQGEVESGASRTMVQFSCKFNNMTPEDQEEADLKRQPFRPFNEAELRADVDEYCTAVSVWACDAPGASDNCTSSMLNDDPQAFEKSPMGDTLVYWHSFAFGFRAHGTTRV